MSYEAVYDATANELSRVKEAGIECFTNIQYEAMRPSILLRPSIQIDGNKWIALYGENLQDGVAGCGDSPAEAFHDFDKNWNEKLKTKL